jgi:hypothetical protein
MAGQSPGKSLQQETALFSGRFLIWLSIAVIVLIAGAIGINIAAHWYGKKILLAGHTVSDEQFSITIGQDRLRLQANTIRLGQQRQNGNAETVDLYLTWPDLQGYGVENRNTFDDLANSGSLLFLQLSQSTMSRDMSGRYEPIYLHLIEGDGQKLKYGLTLHRLRADSGYGQEVILTAPRQSATDYVVRCLLPEAGQPATSADCQRDIHVGRDLTVLYRFSASRLSEWETIDAAVQDYISQRLEEQ